MSIPSDKRKVRFGDVEFDALSLYRITQLIKEYDTETHGEFWSERDGEWKPMASIMSDFSPYPDERLASTISAGIQWVKVSDSGHPDNCAACKSLAGERYSITQAPRLLPLGCNCLPWCRCLIISVE